MQIDAKTCTHYTLRHAPFILSGRTHQSKIRTFFTNKFSLIPKVKVLVVQSCLALCDPMDVAHQVPLAMGFSR